MIFLKSLSSIVDIKQNYVKGKNSKKYCGKDKDI